MIRQIDDELYQVVCDWWRVHEWPIMERRLLPRRGFVSFVGEKPIMAGFLYKDETADFGMFDFLVSNPESSRDERDTAFNFLVDKVEKEAKESGITLLFTVSSHQGFTKRLLHHDFIDSGEGYIRHLIKIIGG